MIEVLFFLLVVHALADYPLQGPFLSRAKRPGGEADMPWQLALGTHALIHAGGVAFVTGSLWLGLAEFVAHSAIDFLKCRKRLTMTQDQALHVACKVVWVAILYRGTL